jgi:APA family basic amino acid/polyamine antiporter
MYSLPIEAWIRLAIWMALGVAIYFLYGKGNSVLGRKNNQG